MYMIIISKCLCLSLSVVFTLYYYRGLSSLSQIGMNRTKTHAAAQIYIREESEVPSCGACTDVLPPPDAANHANLRRDSSWGQLMVTACVQSKMQTFPGTLDFPTPGCSWGFTSTSLPGP